MACIKELDKGLRDGLRELCGQVEGGEGGDELLSFEGDGDDLAYQAEDIFGVVWAVGVVDDTGAGVGGDAVLIRRILRSAPFQGRAVAEAIVKRGGGDTAQEQEVIVAKFGLVFGELHLFDTRVQFGFGIFDLFQRVFGLLLVVDGGPSTF